MTDISSAAILVELNISCWTGQIIDRAATKEVTDGKRASRDAAQVRKNLMAGSLKLKAISDHAATVRLWYNSQTLPWADKGPRLVPTSMFIDFKAKLNAHESVHEQLVRDFILEYPVLFAQAQTNLGDLFRAADYPDQSDLPSKFGFKAVFSPVPTSGDFRVDISKEYRDELEQQYEAAYATRVQEAVGTARDKLREMIESMIEKLKDAEGETKKRYHETLITNAEKLIDLLPHLNITKDAQLDEMRMKFQQALKGVSIDDIREDDTTRGEVKTKLEDVLNQFSKGW